MSGDRAAALDLGSNTFSCLLAERGPDGTLHALLDEERIVGLAEGLDRTGALSDAAMARGEATLAAFSERLRSTPPVQLAAVGTQALREARNASDFRARARRALGVDVQVISGEEEAKLTWRAVTAAFPALAAAGLVVLDIGASSTELIVGRGATPDAVRSLPVGSVRLTERLLAHDVPTPAELATLRRAVEEAWSPHLLPRRNAGRTLVAVAGTATTALAVARGAPLGPGEIEGARLTVRELDSLLARLAAQPLVERRRLPGMVEGRAPYLVAGVAILLGVARLCGISGVTVSGHGVRWGLLHELLDGSRARG